MAKRYGWEKREERKAQKAAAEKAFIEENAAEIKLYMSLAKKELPLAGCYATLKRESKQTINELLQDDVNYFVKQVMEHAEDAWKALRLCGVQALYDTREEAMEHKGIAGGYEDNYYGWVGYKERRGVCQITANSNKWNAYLMPTSGQLKKAVIHYLKEQKKNELAK